MTPSFDRAALEDLLQRPAAADLLPQWGRPSSKRQLSLTAYLERFSQIILQALWFDPALSLQAVNHVWQAHSTELTDTDRARLLRLRAHAYRSVGQMQSAVVDYESARELFDRLDQRRDAAVTAIGEVFALGALGRLEEAQRLHRASIQQFPKDDLRSRARLEVNLATAFYHTAQLNSARRHFERALRIGEECQDDGILGACIHHLGLIALRTGNPQQAMRRLADAEPLLERSGMGIGAMYCRTVQAIAELALGNWESGLKACNDLRQDFSQIGEARAEGLVRREFATGLLSVGALEAAHEEAAKSMKQLEGRGTGYEEAQLACLLGRICVMRGLLQDARGYLQRARRTLDAQSNPWIYHRCGIELARVFVSTDQPKDALDLLRPAQRYLGSVDPNGDGALCRAVRSEAELAMRRYANSLDSAKQAYRRATNYPAILYRPRIALLIARAYGARKKASLAVRWARRAIDELETLLRQFGQFHLRESLVGSRDHLYEEAVQIVQTHSPRRSEPIVLELYARARSATLQEQLAYSSSRSLMRNKLRTAISQLRDDLLLHPENVDMELRRSGIRSEIRRISGALDKTTTLSRRETDRLQRARDPKLWREGLEGRELVLFDQIDGRWQAHVLNAKGAARHVELTELARALRQEWRPLHLALQTAAHMDLERRHEFFERTQRDCLERFEKLRGAIWDRIEATEETVVVVPHGELHDLPLEALATDRVEIVSRIAHPALLPKGRPRRNRTNRALLLHGSSEGTEREARRLAKQLRRSKMQVRVSSSRRSLQGEQDAVSILHVAAHSVSHRQSWLLSGLQLKDGWIGMESIDRRLLRGGLMYLSSCDSGRSYRTPGAGLEGWLTAGLGAGASELMLTLWKLDDETATAFSTDFYEEWCSGSTAAQAAVAARHKMRERQPHPFAWASFVAVG